MKRFIFVLLVAISIYAVNWFDNGNRYPDSEYRIPLYKYMSVAGRDSVFMLSDDSLFLWLRNNGFVDTLAIADSIAALKTRLSQDISDSTQAAIDSAKVVLSDSKAYTDAREIVIEQDITDSTSAMLDSIRTLRTDAKAHAEGAIKDTLVQANVVIPNDLTVHSELTVDGSITTGDRIILPEGGYFESIGADTTAVSDANFLSLGNLVARNAVYAGSEILAEKSYVENLHNIRIQLPDTISAVVGDTLQIFYTGFIEAHNPYNYYIDITCSKGLAYSRYYEYAPIAGDQNSVYPLIVYARDNKMNVLGGDTAIVKVTNPVQPTITTILPLGDSFTLAEYWVTELYRRLTGTGGTPAGKAFTGLKTIGNLGVAPNQRIGYGGKTWQWYCVQTAAASTLKFWFFDTHDKDASDLTSIWSDGTNQWKLDSLHVGRLAFSKNGHTVNAPASGTLTHVSGATHTGDITYTAIETIDGNPLWDYADSELSIADFCTRNSFTDPDVVIPLLTWNGLVSDTPDASDHTYEITYAKIFLDTLHSNFPNAKVLLCPPTMPPRFSGTGYYYEYVRSIIGLNKAYEALSNEAAYSAWVNYTNITMAFDNEYGFGMTLKEVNLRTPSLMREDIVTTGIHPDQYGYYMIADGVYREFISKFCK